jgi:hypothetical protein
MGVEIRYIESVSGRVCYRIMNRRSARCSFSFMAPARIPVCSRPRWSSSRRSSVQSQSISRPTAGFVRGIPTIGDYCDAVIAVADREKADRMLISGHSMGAALRSSCKIACASGSRRSS